MMRTVEMRPIDALNAEWRTICRTRASCTALQALADAEEEIAALRVRNLGELVEAQSQVGGVSDREDRAQVLRAMLRSQRVHPLVPRATLQALVPGLVGVARRLSWGTGGEWVDGGAFFADVLATAWEVILAWSGDDRPYAVLDLLSAVRCRLRRQAMRHRSAELLPALGLDGDGGAVADPRNGSTALDDLARSIDDHSGRGVDPTDAAILYGSCVLGFSISELARMSGRSRRHVTERRRRAAREVCA